jgi:DNA invertase Pin-like site-specific DNA recombinase
MEKKADVAALLRVSTAEQAGVDRAGLERQRQVIQRTIASRNLNCVREIELSDVSGTNVRNCPEVLEILNDIRDRKIQGVVVADLYRLVIPADIGDFVLLQVFQDTGAIIYSGDQAIDLSSDSGYLMGGLQALLAGHELRLIKKRMQGGKEVKRRQGKCPGSKITLPTGVGYDRATEKYYYTDAISKVVEAFRLMDEDGLRNITEIARRVGLVNRTLANLLRNPIFIGYRVYLQKRGAKYPSRNGRQSDRKKMFRAENEIIRIKVIDEPVISPERFERVQHVLNSVKHVWSSKYVKGKATNLGVGVVRCGICGDILYCSSGKRAGRQRTHGYYSCRRNYYLYKGKTGGCELPNLRQADVDTALTECVTEQLTNPSIVKELVRIAVGRIQGQADSAESANDRKQQRIAELNRKLTRLLSGYEDGAIDLPTYRQRKQQLEGDIRLLETSPSSSAQPKAAIVDTQRMKRSLVRGAVAFARASSPELKRSALRRLFSEITISSKGVEGFRFMPQFHAYGTETGIHSDRDSSQPPT